MDYVGIRVITKNSVGVGSPAGAITNEVLSLKSNTEYMLQFKIINYSSVTTLNHIVAIKDGISTLIAPSLNILDFKIVNTFEDEGITKQERLCYVKFIPSKDGDYKFGICRTLLSGDKANSKLFDVREVSCERGTILQDYKDNSDDLRAFVRKTETFFEQTDQKFLLVAKKEDINKSNAAIEILSDNINLKVSKDNLISSINLSPEAVTIKANKIDMTGKLDLNGTFTCYKDGANKRGHYLFQSGAMHRGHLEGRANPTYSSGIWRPDGVNDMGYVSVGWTNSDHVDENGCLWMSPLAGGGGQLIYSKLLSPGVASVSGITYSKNGLVEYHSALADKVTDGVKSHRFDGGVGCYTLHATQGYFDGSLRVNASVYTDQQSLFLSAGGYNGPYNLQLMSTGYLLPKGNIQLGQTTNPFYQLVCTHAPAVVSDERKKANIKYIDYPIMTLPMNEYEEVQEIITKDDMYNYIKYDLKLATYELVDNREEDAGKVDIGFIAQDIKDTKIGKYIVNSNDENNLVYDIANRISVLEGALQVAIRKIEALESLGN